MSFVLRYILLRFLKSCLADAGLLPVLQDIDHSGQCFVDAPSGMDVELHQGLYTYLSVLLLVCFWQASESPETIYTHHAAGLISFCVGGDCGCGWEGDFKFVVKGRK